MLFIIQKFQEIEEEHLKTIIGHLEVYIDSHMAGWKMMEEVCMSVVQSFIYNK